MTSTIIRGDYEIRSCGDQIIVNGQSYNRNETCITIYPQSIGIQPLVKLYSECEEFVLGDSEITSEFTADLDYFNDCLFSFRISKKNIARLLRIQSENDIPFTLMLASDLNIAVIFKLSPNGDFEREEILNYEYFSDDLGIEACKANFDEIQQASIEKGMQRQSFYQNLMNLTSNV